jgi:RNA polymerase sigma-70 factor (sigma-E family)
VASDAEHFAAFVAARGPTLLRAATLLSGSQHDGEDLLQGALERSYRRWPSLRRSGRAEAYVRRALVNAVINRSRRFRLLREESVPSVPEVAVPDEFDSVTNRDWLLTALRSLPTRQRAVLVFRYFEDLSESEVSQLMNCSVGTVKSQTSRALARLRQDASVQAMLTCLDGARCD